MTTCANCGHEIAESYKFSLNMGFEAEPPIRWIHIQRRYRAKSEPTKTTCDAIYFGVECTQGDSKTSLDSFKFIKCKCYNPKPSPYQPESKSATALKLLQAYNEYMKKIAALDK